MPGNSEVKRMDQYDPLSSMTSEEQAVFLDTAMVTTIGMKTVGGGYSTANVPVGKFGTKPDWNAAAGSDAEILNKPPVIPPFTAADAGKCLSIDPTGALVWRYVSEALVIDGRAYRTVKIGTQTWMAENLEADMFGGVWYNNEKSTYQPLGYGKLYTWDEASAIEVPGWHLPSMSEFETLETYAGENPGLKLKSTDWTWTGNYPPNHGTDDFGFAAKPAGYWADWSEGSDPTQEEFYNAGSMDWIWTSDTADDPSDQYSINTAWTIKLGSMAQANNLTYEYNNKTYYKCSVRLIKDY